MTHLKEYKKLVIAPHLDDEVLGCGGVLDKNTFVLYVGADENLIKDKWVRERPAPKERLEEMAAVQKYLGFTYEILNNKVNHYVENDLISPFELAINTYKPDIVFTPNPSYNQDHRAIYNAGLVALRPHDLNHFVGKVLVYEQVQDIQSAHIKQFNPCGFVEIDIERKLHAYGLYRTQVRKFRSPDMVRTLAKLRGLQSNADYAEAFEVLKWKV